MQTLLVLRNRDDNYVADLPEDILYYILHMCGTQWAGAEPPPPGPVAEIVAKSSSRVGVIARRLRNGLRALLGM